MLYAYLTWQESTESVAFRMLDKVWAIELIPTTLKKQIRPYMIEHSLNEDDIFSKYIKVSEVILEQFPDYSDIPFSE